jgi:hypothetical protein
VKRNAELRREVTTDAVSVQRLRPRWNLAVEEPNIAATSKAAQASAVVSELAFDDGAEVDEPTLRIAVPKCFYSDG